jgi:hypothetical protein
MNMSEEEGTFFDALQDHLDLDITGVGATYDEDDEDDNHSTKQHNDDSEGPPLPKDSVLTAYLKGIQKCLHIELSQKKGKTGVRQWLLQELKKFNWVLPRQRVSYICNELPIEMYEIGYYRDVHVWFSEDQWGNNFLPPFVRIVGYKYLCKALRFPGTCGTSCVYAAICLLCYDETIQMHRMLGSC